MTTPEVDAGGRRSDRWRGPTLGGALGLGVVVVGVAIGLRPLFDNSFFTHLATGRLILERGSVPDTDPFTFTAMGEPWVVQSWLATWLYATVERLAGLVGLRLLMGLVAGVLTALAWRLTRPIDSILPRLAVAIVFLVTASGLWGERPFMLGLVALALVVLAGEGWLDPRWLIPVGWLWVNVHGSFPLGIVYLAVVAIGRRLDGDRPVVELRALGWLVPGVLLGAVGPLGLRVLTFPVDLLQRQDVLRHVVEWQAPGFTTLSERAFLVQVIVAIVLVARRPSYRSALVVAVFTAAALLGARNISVASLVLLPAMAPGLRGLGSLASGQRDALARTLGAVGVVALGAVLIVRLDQPDLRLTRYPVDAVALLADRSVDLHEHRLAAPDRVGNYLELLYGSAGVVFYDDRFDMFPDEVTDAHLALAGAAPSWRAELEAYDIDLAIWDRSRGLARVLIADPAWRTLYVDEGWVLACRRGSDLDGAIGVC